MLKSGKGEGEKKRTGRTGRGMIVSYIELAIVLYI